MLPQSLLFKVIGIALLVTCIFFSGWHIGAGLKQGQWDKERASNAIALSNAITEANNKVFMAEHAANDRIAAISTLYETKLKEQKNAQARLINLNATGGLYINAYCPNSDTANGNTAAAARLSHGASRVQLSQSDGAFLIGFADDADQVANQLAACQAVILSDRKVKP